MIDHYATMFFEKTLIGLALCRMDGQLVYVNPAFSELLGRSVAETLALTYWEITPEKYQQQEQQQLESLDKHHRYGPYEKEYIHSSGKLIPVRLSGQLVEIEGETYILSSVEDISDRKHAENQLTRLHKKLERLSFQDCLTGISNRRMFDQTLANEWARAQRNQTPISLIMIDVDFFKEYNDQYGHLKGDDCLKKIAANLEKQAKRPSDLASRYGGEEFTLLLPETDLQQAIQVIEQCFQSIKELHIEHKSSVISGYITISAGLSHMTPNQDLDATQLIEQADKMLYRAKKANRNCYRY